MLKGFKYALKRIQVLFKLILLYFTSSKVIRIRLELNSVCHMKKTIYKGKIFSLEKETTRVRGKSVKITRVIEPDIVVVLPLLDEKTVLLERQYRHVLNKFIYEIPAGHTNKNEKLIDAARRELLEETGYLAKNLKHILSVYPMPGLTTAMSNLFVATNLEKASKNLDDTEIIKVKKVKISELDRLIKENKIVDVKTIIALLYYLRYLKKN